MRRPTMHCGRPHTGSTHAPCRLSWRRSGSWLRRHSSSGCFGCDAVPGSPASLCFSHAPWRGVPLLEKYQQGFRRTNMDGRWIAVGRTASGAGARFSHICHLRLRGPVGSRGVCGCCYGDGVVLDRRGAVSCAAASCFGRTGAGCKCWLCRRGVLSGGSRPRSTFDRKHQVRLV
jgi:hypothetical protein